MTPALAARVFFTRMSGLGDMKMHSQGIDVSISKGFVVATPYAGVGVVGKASTESGQWASESYTQMRAFAGVNFNLALLNLALLDAAFEVFGRQGNKETTMRLICAQARMSDRYFYEHFGSLDDIFVQVRQRLAVELMDTIMQVLARPQPDPVLMIRGALTAFFEYVKKDPGRARILLLDAMSFGLTSTEVAMTRLSWYATLIEGRLKARYPTLPPHLNAKLIASGFLGHVTYVSTVWTLQKFDTPVDELVDHAAYAWMGLHEWLRDHDASVPRHSTG